MRGVTKEGGQGMVEYAVLLALVCVVSIVVLGALGASLHGLLLHVLSGMGSATSSTVTP